MLVERQRMRQLYPLGHKGQMAHQALLARQHVRGLVKRQCVNLAIRRGKRGLACAYHKGWQIGQQNCACFVHPLVIARVGEGGNCSASGLKR